MTQTKSAINKTIHVFLLVFLFVISACSAEEITPPKEATIKVMGTQFMVNLLNSLYEGYGYYHPEDVIWVSGEGESPGFTAFAKGVVDLVSSTREISDRETEELNASGITPQKWTVGYHALAVIVNKETPLESISMDELRGIFMGEITDWSELGLLPGRIRPVMLDQSSGDYQLFSDVVLDGEDASPSLLTMEINEDILDRIINDQCALGVIALEQANTTVKRVPLEVEGREIPADDETVRSGQYPLCRPVYLYSSAEPSDSVKNFLKYVLDYPGQAIVKGHDLISVSERYPK
jgi:phosphate transport system substrate-binding protein